MAANETMQKEEGTYATRVQKCQLRKVHLDQLVIPVETERVISHLPHWPLGSVRL
jgi:hypothetical protein